MEVAMPTTLSNADEVTSQPYPLIAFKVTGIAVSSMLWAILLVRTVVALAAGTSPWLVLPALLVGYLFADLILGIMHWFCDAFFKENTPIIGTIVIQPFRDHHVHPQRITRYRFIEQDTTNFFLMLPPLAVAFWMGERLDRGASARSSRAAYCWAWRRDRSAPISSTNGRTHRTPQSW